VLGAVERRFPQHPVFSVAKDAQSIRRGELHSNLIFRLRWKTPVVELSMLNAGAMVDIELPVVWNARTGQVTQTTRHNSIYLGVLTGMRLPSVTTQALENCSLPQEAQHAPK